MAINLKTCNSICKDCIKDYANKYKLGRGDKFSVNCSGIPQQYIPNELLSSLDMDPSVATAMIDPITWAAKYLDWYCLDPDGEIWKRKTLDGSIGSAPPFEPDNPAHIQRVKNGKSPFHRPYQEQLLRCSSKRKIFRLGRQLGKTESLIISILFNMFTREKFNVEVIAPFQAQIDLIFTRITELIRTNVSLSNSILRSVKAPMCFSFPHWANRFM